ncbi:MAG: hypothetical protein GF398_17090 [Chitinivibrionales bacterium]|nr:hypothetical protein [Chitinivibrionales bacterium]
MIRDNTHGAFYAILIVLLIWNSIDASVSPAEIFGNGMVLQRNAPVAVWGAATGETTVTVNINGQSKSTSITDNAWKVMLDPMPAGGPYEMTISGSNSITISDILIGDVWLGGGQSNMVISLVEYTDSTSLDIQTADYPHIRLRQIGFGRYDGRSPGTESYNMLKNGDWVACSPTSVQRFSAVMFYMGRELYTSTNVPQGLVVEAVVGSSAQSWMPPLLESDPYAKAWLDYRQDILDSVISHPDQNHPDYNDPSSENPPNGGRNWNKIEKLLPYTYSGIFWWQGEAEERARRYWQYFRIYPALISGWRRYADGADIPFFALSEPNGGGWENAPIGCAAPEQDSVHSESLMYEAFLMATQMKNVGVVSCLGLSGGTHPDDKDKRGIRAADWVRANIYHENVTYNGPLYEGYSVEGDKVRIFFQEQTNRGLRTIGGGELQGFSIAGGDGVFELAQAEIQDDEVVVWSTIISEPKHVRYGWGGTRGSLRCANLSNESNLQAYPFRTDDATIPTDKVTAVIPRKEMVNFNVSGNLPLTLQHAQFVVYNLQGKIIAQVDKKSLQTRCSRLPKGTYIVGNIATMNTHTVIVSTR